MNKRSESLSARARAVGLNVDTVAKRRRAGWIEADLLTPPQPIEHPYRSRKPAKSAHPWKVWKVGRFSRRDAAERGP